MELSFKAEVKLLKEKIWPYLADADLKFLNGEFSDVPSKN